MKLIKAIELEENRYQIEYIDENDIKQRIDYYSESLSLLEIIRKEFF